MRYAPLVLATILAVPPVSAANAPVVRIVDADPQAGVQLASSSAETTFRVPLEIEGGAVERLSASVDDLAASDKTRLSAKVTLDGHPASEPVAFPAGARPVLTISVFLPAVGTYGSRVVLLEDRKPIANVPLSITRQLATTSAELHGLATVVATKWCTADAKIRFSVRETAGASLRLHPPVVEGFVLKEGDKVSKQARHGGVTWEPGVKAGETWTIRPGVSVPVVVTIPGIEEAGTYSGTIRLSIDGGAPVTQEVTVLVKEHGVIAIFWIFLGVSASYLIRRYTKERRPRLETLRRVAYLDEDLAEFERQVGAFTPPVRAAFDALLGRLRRIERDVRSRIAKDGAAAALDETEKRIQALPDWLRVGRSLDAVKPQDLVVAARADWEALVASWFRKAGAADDLGPSLEKIERAIRDAVLERIAAFEGTAKAYAAVHQDAAADIEGRVLPKVSTAKDHAAKGRWPELTQAFGEARLEYTKSMAQELGRVLGAPTPPLGFDAAGWNELKNRVLGDLRAIEQEGDADRAADVHARVSRAYFDAIVEKLARRVEELFADAPAADTKELADATAALAAARRGAGKEDWEEARQRYDQAAIAVAAVLGRRSQSQPAAFREAPRLAARFVAGTVPAGASKGTSLQVPALTLRKPSRAERLTDAIDTYDALVNLAVLVIACVVGLTLLWWNDPVWGGGKSYATALLWGLGLHQVAGSALAGFPAVEKEVLK